MEKITVLLVEDEELLSQTIREYLELNGFNVLTAGDGEEAVDMFHEQNTDIQIVLLDLMLPKMSGFEVLKDIRSISDVPVLILSAKTSEEDQIRGYELGADEYVTKPLMLSVLKMRIDAVYSRVYGKSEKLVAGVLEVDSRKRKAYVNAQMIELTRKEYEVLIYFMQNRDTVLERSALLDNVWGVSYYGSDRTVDTVIKQLRMKLGDAADYIQTVYGVGYRFEEE